MAGHVGFSFAFIQLLPACICTMGLKRGVQSGHVSGPQHSSNTAAIGLQSASPAQADTHSMMQPTDMLVCTHAVENVRNFVSHNKSFTFRLTIRTLLEMGYQVGTHEGLSVNECVGDKGIWGELNSLRPLRQLSPAACHGMSVLHGRPAGLYAGEGGNCTAICLATCVHCRCALAC